MKAVQDGIELQAGDEVEFSVILNQRTGKCSACNVFCFFFVVVVVVFSEERKVSYNTVSKKSKRNTLNAQTGGK